MPEKIIPSYIKNLNTELKKALGEDLKNVVLFGSRAGKKAGKESDFDVLIILNSECDKNCRSAILNVIYNIELKHDIFIDFKIISTFELNQTLRGKQPLFIDAVNNGLYL
jgi:predicted nucleotidyltransferase